MKVSEDNKKKEPVQVIIATGTIFIFNFMSQCETVWQIEIIMYIVNCFNVINSAFTELILIMWGCHLAITKYFIMQTMNMFSYIYIYIYTKREMHPKSTFSKPFSVVVNMLRVDIRAI